MTKKFVTFSLFIFVAIISGVAVIGFVSRDKNIQQANNIISGTNSNLRTTKNTLTLTSAELSKHNSYNSCWLLISGKIYDVTPYLNSHPGGEAEILKTCGTDATIIYDNRDNTGTHSSRARSMLADYYIGDLNQTITISPNPSNPSGQATPPIANPAVQTTKSRSGGDDNEFDD